MAIGNRRVSRWGLVAPVAALLAILLRLPFLHSPLTADEGGYAEVARLWARGRTLYEGAWVDRPQGLLLVFRGLLGTGVDSTTGLRLAAAGAAVLLALLAFALGAELGGGRRGALAALLVATAGASPFIEGFTLSGELLAGVAAACSLLAFARYERTGGAAWLAGSGLAAGSAWMVKQSFFDAALAVCVFLAWSRGRRAGWALLLFGAAATLPVVAGVLASGDAGAWLNAVVGYGLHASGPAQGVSRRFGSFASSVWAAARALGAVAILAAAGWRAAPRLLRLWFLAACLGVLAGGGFHPHYYLQLVVPLSLLAVFVPLRRRFTVVFAAAAVLAVLPAIPLWGEDGAAQARAIWPRDPHLRTDAAVARYLRARTRPGQRVYVLWAAADVYYLADRAPASRYLWLRNVETIRGARAQVLRLIERRAAALVAVEQPPSVADPTGAVAAALRDRYRLAARIDGIPVYRPRR